MKIFILVDDIKEMVMFLSQQMHQLGSLRNEIIPLPEQVNKFFFVL